MQQRKSEALASRESGGDPEREMPMAELKTALADASKRQQTLAELNAELRSEVTELKRITRILRDEEARYRTLFERKTEEAVHENERLRRRHLERVIAIQEEERRRVSRELHDVVGQSLTSVLVELRLLEKLGDLPEVRAGVRKLRRRVADGIDEMRRLARGLHPANLESLGFRAAVEQLTEELQCNFEVDLHLRGFDDRPPPEPVAVALYRIVQEALTNVVRHAGAGWVSVVLTRNDSGILLLVEDDGRGLEERVIEGPGRGLGLEGIRERAELLGGTLTLESSPAGVVLVVRLPPSEGVNGES